MNLETRIDDALWQAISNSYLQQNHTGAILDAIYHLGDLVRERADLESDGVTLVGQALGGTAPRLRVNRLRTESERNVQRGTEQLLRGLFQAVRNPRSHEKHVDSREDSIAIILFVDYLVRVIGQSVSRFSLELTLRRILDPDFVGESRYADLVVAEIPVKKRLDVFHAVLDRLDGADCRKVRFFIDALLRVSAEDESREIVDAFSGAIRNAEGESEFRELLQALPRRLWDDLDPLASLRLENKVIESMNEGSYLTEYDRCTGGAFATWAQDILIAFELKGRVLYTLASHLASGEIQKQDYVLRFFFSYIEDLADSPPPSLVAAINDRLNNGDERFKKAMDGSGWMIKSWLKPFEKALESFEAAQPTKTPGYDDIPF